jgi:hypothetical protein
MARSIVAELAIALVFGVTSVGALGIEGPEPNAAAEFVPLFPQDSLDGWQFSDWADLRTPPKVEGVPWRIEKGVLSGLDKHTWVFSKQDYADFVLKFEGKISKGANSGIGVRFPPEGDPAYRGMEIQFVDGEVYYHSGNWHGARLEQLTGSIYDEIAAKKAAKPAGQWNRFEITCQDTRVTVVLNGKKVVEVDVSKETKARQQKGPPLAERPRKGRIGFQNLSGTVTLRNQEIKTLQ